MEGRKKKDKNEGRDQVLKTDLILHPLKHWSNLIQQVFCRCTEKGLAVNFVSFLAAIAAVTVIQVVWLMH